MGNVAYFFGFAIFLVSTVCELECHHDGVQHHTDWTGANKMPIKRVAGVDLQWFHNDEQFLIMEVKGRTMGYVSVGFCPEAEWNDSMKGCDIVMGWVDNQNATGFIRVSIHKLKLL